MVVTFLLEKKFSKHEHFGHKLLERGYELESNSFPAHPVERSFNSDWFVNSFIMVVYEKIFFKFSQNLVSQRTIKKFF